MRLTSRTLGIALTTLALTSPSIARADIEPDPQHDVSLTFSPAHFILPMFEAQAEFRLNPTLGLAFIAGFGGVSVESSDGTSASASVFDIGAKLAWYAVGDFEEGLQVGVEVLYVGVSGDAEDDFDGSSFAGNGLSLAPFIGYKIVADVGFTFEAQLGPALVIASAEDSDGDSASETSLLPMLNLNVGWSL